MDHYYLPLNCRHRSSLQQEKRARKFSRQNAINYHLPQVFRHSLLLLFMVCSMIADKFLSVTSSHCWRLYLHVSLPVWKLLNQEGGTIDGSYKVMVSIDIILTTGQGLLIFSMFIADYDLIVAPVEDFINKIKEKIKELLPKYCKKNKSRTNAAFDNEGQEDLSEAWGNKLWRN